MRQLCCTDKSVLHGHQHYHDACRRSSLVQLHPSLGEILQEEYAAHQFHIIVTSLATICDTLHGTL